MLNSLPKESVLVFSPVIAEVTSLEEAIFLYQIDYWVTKNEEANRNFHDGRYWTFNGYKEWGKQFPFWSKNTIIRIIKKLEKKNLIRTTDKYNQKAYDQTKWYTINYEEVEKILPLELTVEATPTHNDQGGVPKLGSTPTQNEQGGIPIMSSTPTQNEYGGYPNWVGGVPKLGKPIPEITPEITSETTKEINQIIKEEEEEASASEKSLTSFSLKFKANFTDIEIHQAKRFINPSMFKTKEELELSEKHFNRIICYMKMAGMKYIAPKEYRNKNIEIEKNGGKDGKGNPITDKAFYIVNGISLSKRDTENADQQAYQLDKAQESYEKKSEDQTNEKYPDYVKSVKVDENGNAYIIFTDEMAERRNKAHKQYEYDLKHGITYSDDDIPLTTEELDNMGIY